MPPRGRGQVVTTPATPLAPLTYGAPAGFRPTQGQGRTPAAILQAAYNEALRFMDPQTQHSTAQWLARQNVKKFGG